MPGESLGYLGKDPAGGQEADELPTHCVEVKVTARIVLVGNAGRRKVDTEHLGGHALPGSRPELGMDRLGPDVLAHHVCYVWAEGLHILAPPFRVGRLDRHRRLAAD